MWIVDSRILVSGERRTMSLYEMCWSGSLLGLRIGMTLADFHMVGMILELMTLLNRFVMMEIE